MGKYLWTGQQQSRYKGTVVARRFRRDDGNHRGQRAEQPGQGSSNMFQYLILWHLVTSCDILWHFSFLIGSMYSMSQLTALFALFALCDVEVDIVSEIRSSMLDELDFTKAHSVTQCDTHCPYLPLILGFPQGQMRPDDRPHTAIYCICLYEAIC